MKKRNGYVSNSSSSSFVVVIHDDESCAPAITKEQEDILFSYGFRYINEDWRHALRNGAKHLIDRWDGPFCEGQPIAMYYDVSCNEQDVMDFLFENHIPFVESEEYGTRTVHYDGENDWYDTYVNAGTRFLIYGMRMKEHDKLDKDVALRFGRSFYRTRISDGKEIGPQ